MRNIKCFIIFALIPFCVRGQELINPAESQFIAKFPFKIYSGGVMIVNARFENLRDTFNFILDTGSGGISLDSATCAEHGIQPKATDTSITGIGGIRKVSFVFDKTLHLPDITVKHLNFHINDYSVLTSVYGEKIDGIIGYSFFSRYIVKIDFDSLLVKVYTPGKIAYPGNSHTLHPIFTTLPILLVDTWDRKKIPFNFYFDTGAGLCFLMSEKFAADSAVLLSKRKPKITQAEGMMGRLQMRLTVIKAIKIGPYRFKQVPTYIYQDVYNVTSYPFSGGLIGNELLRRFNMIINYPHREINLKPNSHFNESFDYAYTGLGIYLIDGLIVAGDVIKGSPADHAGIKVDDEIMVVGNNTSGNIQQYKNLLHVANDEIKVIIKRKGELSVLILKTSSIR